MQNQLKFRGDTSYADTHAVPSNYGFQLEQNAIASFL